MQILAKEHNAEIGFLEVPSSKVDEEVGVKCGQIRNFTYYKSYGCYTVKLIRIMNFDIEQMLSLSF